MKLLLHACCGPCALYPLSVIREEGIKDVCCYFYNPNIHPYKEFKKRIQALLTVSKCNNVETIYERKYELTDFLRKIVFHENERCHICYNIRLQKTVEYAKAHGFNSFTTSLLYSRYQDHNFIIDRCVHLARISGLDFFYRDFREGWQKGIEESKSLDIYRQSYCGCIYSEQESFDKTLRKRLPIS
jgi:hypothetical protein